MGNILLLYESRTGFTETYAQWIGQTLNTASTPLRSCRKEQLQEAGLILFGGGIHGSVLGGLDKFRRLHRRAKQTPVLYFAVGLRPHTERTIDLLRRNNFPAQEQPYLCYLRGGMKPDKLSPGDKTMARCYRAMLRRRGSVHPEDEAVAELFKTPCDYTDPEQILPLLDAVQQEISNSGK